MIEIESQVDEKKGLEGVLGHHLQGHNLSYAWGTLTYLPNRPYGTNVFTNIS